MTTFTTIGLPWRERLFRSSFPYWLSDLFALALAYYATLLIRFQSPLGKQFFAWINVTAGVRETAEVGTPLEWYYINHAPRILFILAVTLILLYAMTDLYARRRFIRHQRESLNVIVANLSALALFYAYFYLTRNEFHPRSVFATLLAINVVTTLTCRSFMRAMMGHSRRGICRVVLIGQGPEAEFIDRYISITRPEGLEIVARVPGGSVSPDLLFHQVREAVGREHTHLILCAEKTLTVAQIMQLLELAEGLGQEVKILSDRLNVLVNEAGIRTDFFMELPLVHFGNHSNRPAGARARQAASRVMAVLLLVASAPLMTLIAILIKLGSTGPVFFMQERIGIDRRPFRMFKFRTMRDRADELQAQIEEFNESGEGLFKIKKDPRVTGIGRILRRFSLDELPQLINVVRGEMSLVGPRPLPRRDYENYYEEWHYSRHSGLPGLTCLWQISGRSDVSFHNMCILDDYYLRNQNALLDLKILFRTVGVVLFAKGAY